MPSTFLGLNTGLSGLNYFQSALNTTSHNISNSNTEGYSRQQILVSASNPVSINQPYGMMGTGVSGNSIDRLRNAFYDNKYWAASSKYNQYNSQFDKLSELQTYMNEMSGDAGYTKWLSQLSSALQDISDNPADYTTRISYTLTADSFTDVINELANNYQNSQKSINDEIELAVSEINSLSKQIYELTQEIINIELKGANANDLRDKRGVCIDKLSEYVDVDVEEHSIMYGVGEDAVASSASAMSVRINGKILVDEMEFNELIVVPRSQKINQNDVDGLVDIAWMCPDGTPGEEFNPLETVGKVRGLFEVRDGNNGDFFAGEVTATTATPATATIAVTEPIHVDKLNIPMEGIITLNGKDYWYDGWSAEYDEDGFLTNFTFNNMTMYDDKGVEITAVFPDDIAGHKALIGSNISTKGIPYYMAQLNELVRTFSKEINGFTTSGVDENGDAGLDMFTAEDPFGKDFVLKGTMEGTGTITSSSVSYYRLTALNWELNQDWKNDPAKVVVSYADDIAQGNVEARPIIDKIMFAMTDQNLFQQGTISQFMQSMTTTMAVDIAKMDAFTANQDDIKYTIDSQRLSVSGVDENEETSDLVKFQNLYSLASKVISVLNEVYDKLINDTGV
ncbi:MAG: flagellar hook-associated protein FlgK [Lachnospiraceae bacterium]|nr:flagellar hook-associated protein FlgK [Lachnospiraceae bacterium]